MKNSTTPIIIGGVAVLAIGALFVMTKNKGEVREQVLGPDQPSAAQLDAAARIREAEAREREATLAAEVRKKELEALDKPLTDRFVDFVFDSGSKFIGGLSSGSLKF